MNEIEITSGRMNPHIDPHLTIWGWEIPVYLFIGGLVAGLLFFSALFYIRGNKEKYLTAVKFAPIFALQSTRDSASALAALFRTSVPVPLSKNALFLPLRSFSALGKASLIFFTNSLSNIVNTLELISADT